MRYTFSALAETMKTQAKFDKWVEEMKQQVKDLAYENCRVIDKGSITYHQDLLESIKKAYKPLKQLRKKSSVYDAAICIDRKGSVELWVYFPITQKESEMAREQRLKKIGELGMYGDVCYTYDDAIWDITHERVYKAFNFAKPIETAFTKVDILVRKMQIFRFI